MSIILLIRLKYLSTMFGDTDNNRSCWKIPPEFKKPYGYRDDIFHDKMKRLRDVNFTGSAGPSLQGWLCVHPPDPVGHSTVLPDRFIFTGSCTDWFKQVGNAVLPLSGKAVRRV